MLRDKSWRIQYLERIGTVNDLLVAQEWVRWSFSEDPLDDYYAQWSTENDMPDEKSWTDLSTGEFIDWLEGFKTRCSGTITLTNFSVKRSAWGYGTHDLKLCRETQGMKMNETNVWCDDSGEPVEEKFLLATSCTWYDWVRLNLILRAVEDGAFFLKTDDEASKLKPVQTEVEHFLEGHENWKLQLEKRKRDSSRKEASQARQQRLKKSEDQKRRQKKDMQSKRQQAQNVVKSGGIGDLDSKSQANHQKLADKWEEGQLNKDKHGMSGITKSISRAIQKGELGGTRALGNASLASSYLRHFRDSIHSYGVNEKTLIDLTDFSFPRGTKTILILILIDWLLAELMDKVVASMKREDKKDAIFMDLRNTVVHSLKRILKIVF